jgi:hypothetical protein
MEEKHRQIADCLDRDMLPRLRHSKFKIRIKLTIVLAALGAAMWTPSVRVTRCLE